MWCTADAFGAAGAAGALHPENTTAQAGRAAATTRPARATEAGASQKQASGPESCQPVTYRGPSPRKFVIRDQFTKPDVVPLGPLDSQPYDAPLGDP